MEQVKWHRLDTVGSTNTYLKELDGGDPDFGYEVAVADFQTSGHGQKGNSWESEPGKNLLFSILSHPLELKVQEQFFISESIALAVADSVTAATGEHFSVKWPNDIYWHDKKLAGILIENTLQGSRILDSITGVGLDVNQEVFRSDAPNPVSLKNITGRDYDRDVLLEDIVSRFIGLMASDRRQVHERYHSCLYRREGLYAFRDAQGRFMASIDHVEGNGCLVLKTGAGEYRTYEFKQVAFILDEK